MPSRRHYLGFAASAAAVATAGCVSALGSDEEPTNSADTSTLAANERTRGEADSITVERTITDSSYEYVSENDTVRYPAERSGGDVAEYGHKPFDDWAYIEAASVASRVVWQQLESRLESMAFLRVGKHASEESTVDIGVVHRTEVDDSGTVINEPDVPVSRVVEAAPRSVTVTVEFAGKTATNEYSVFVLNEVVESVAAENES